MYKPENKQEICRLLLATLQATRGAGDLIALAYEKDPNGYDEIVTAVFKDGGRTEINVSMDSGTAMIRDIMRALD